MCQCMCKLHKHASVQSNICNYFLSAKLKSFFKWKAKVADTIVINPNCKERGTCTKKRLPDPKFYKIRTYYIEQVLFEKRTKQCWR